LALTALWLAGCGAAGVEPSSGGDASPADEPAEIEGANENDAPEISRGVGEEGGVVVLWPRVIPATEDAEIVALAGSLQQRLTEVARAAVPGGAIDTRPQPERVCPRSGCRAASLGAVLVHVDGGCVALGLVAEPGASPTRILAWAGDVKLGKTEVPFREPPESEVKIVDAVPCKDLGKALGDAPAELSDALAAAAGG
jgi:hypothetical protein